MKGSRKLPEARDQGLPARDRSSKPLRTPRDENASRGLKRPSVPLKARGGGGNSSPTAPLRFKYS